MEYQYFIDLPVIIAGLLLALSVLLPFFHWLDRAEYVRGE